MFCRRNKQKIFSKHVGLKEMTASAGVNASSTLGGVVPGGVTGYTDTPHRLGLRDMTLNKYMDAQSMDGACEDYGQESIYQEPYRLDKLYCIFDMYSKTSIVMNKTWLKVLIVYTYRCPFTWETKLIWTFKEGFNCYNLVYNLIP